MPSFAYKLRLSSGAISQGVIDAADQNAAIARLKHRQGVILELKPNKKNLLEILKTTDLSKLSLFKPKPKSKDIVIFSRQLATLVSAGVPLVKGLTVLTEQIENPGFKDIVSDIKENIESGQTIYDSMKKHPSAFSNLYVSMIKAGEIGGILDVILERLSSYLESSEELKGKVKGALIYPAIIALVAMSVTVFLLVFVIPKFRVMFTDFGTELPWPTKILITASDFMKANILYLLGAVAAIVVAGAHFYKTNYGRFQADKLFLKLPMFGILLKKVAVAKFTRTLGTLVKSGVPILQALDTVAQTSGNRVIEAAIMNAKESVKEGEKISTPLKSANLFPPMVVQMIAVGEETGNLDVMLTKIADFYDQEVDAAVKGLTAMIEPVVMVVMGLAVGFIVIAMFMPMFEIGGLASQAG